MAKIMKIDIDKVDYSTYRTFLSQVAEQKNQIIILNSKITTAEREYNEFRKKALEIEKTIQTMRRQREDMKEELIDALPQRF